MERFMNIHEGQRAGTGAETFREKQTCLPPHKQRVDREGQAPSALTKALILSSLLVPAPASGVGVGVWGSWGELSSGWVCIDTNGTSAEAERFFCEGLDRMPTLVPAFDITMFKAKISLPSKQFIYSSKIIPLTLSLIHSSGQNRSKNCLRVRC